MAIDVRVIDTKTSRIVAATSVEGTATDVNLGGALGGYGTGGALRGSLSGWKNTPIEKALRICIQKAVEFIVSKTPEVYYRHGAGAQVAAATASTGTSAGSQTKVSPNYAAGQVARVKSASLNMIWPAPVVIETINANAKAMKADEKMATFAGPPAYRPAMLPLDENRSEVANPIRVEVSEKHVVCKIIRRMSLTP